MKRRPQTRPRPIRKDAVANRLRLLDAAAATVRREGDKVAIAKIAEEAGVGVGTLYRHFPNRQALLAAVSHRAFRVVLGHAHCASDSGQPAIACIADFLEHIVADRDHLVLPFHGGPVSLDKETLALRAEVREVLGSILERGQKDKTIRAGITALDIIIAGALFAQPLPHVADWDSVASRQIQIFLRGLST